MDSISPGDAPCDPGESPACAIRGHLIEAGSGSKNPGLSNANTVIEDLIFGMEASVRAGTSAGLGTMALLSHELRTPLSTIMVCTDMMLSGIAGATADPSTSRYLEIIHRSSQQMMRLIDGFLDLARLDAGLTGLREERFPLDHFLSETTELVELPAMRNRISVAVMQVPNVVITGDRLRLSEVLANLLSNAVKYTGPGGSVTVSASVGHDGGLTINVEDTGIGLDAADLAVVLEPFGRAATARRKGIPGTGLGLPLAKRLIESHGGGLTISSVEGLGTKVSVHLPADRVEMPVA